MKARKELNWKNFLVYGNSFFFFSVNLRDSVVND